MKCKEMYDKQIIAQMCEVECSLYEMQAQQRQITLSNKIMYGCNIIKFMQEINKECNLKYIR